MWRHETDLESKGLDADGLLNSGHCSQLDPPGGKNEQKKTPEQVEQHGHCHFYYTISTNSVIIGIFIFCHL